MVTEVLPSELCDVIEVTPGMVENWLSSGVATDDAMVDGSAPGKLAETKMAGKSTGGNSETGKVEEPNKPKITNAAISSVVRTGRSIKIFEMFMVMWRADL